MQVKFEMKLPSGSACWHVAERVCESEANLDQFGAFDIVPDVLVIEFILCVEVGQRGFRYHAAWELCVLRGGFLTKAITE